MSEKYKAKKNLKIQKKNPNKCANRPLNPPFQVSEAGQVEDSLTQSERPLVAGQGPCRYHFQGTLLLPFSYQTRDCSFELGVEKIK